jgi:hypothetical protein
VAAGAILLAVAIVRIGTVTARLDGMNHSLSGYRELIFLCPSGDDYRRRSRSPRAAPRREDREEDYPRKEDYRREKEPREYERRY